MHKIRVVATVLLLAAPVLAQAPPRTQVPPAPGLTGPAAVAAALANLERTQMTVQGLTQALRMLQGNLEAAAGVREQVDKLAADAAAAQAAGNLGMARRHLLQAIAVQRGQPWDARAEFGGSLRLRTSTIVTDSSRPLYVHLTQTYWASYAAPAGLRLRVTLADFSAPEKIVREVGTFEVYSRDLSEEPYTFAADLSGLPDGPYQLAAELTDGGTLLRRLALNVLTVRDLDAREKTIPRRLDRVSGFDSLKATIRYPFDYARVVNRGGRDLIPGRNPEDSTTNAYFDFSAEIQRSFELLEALEAGKDPLFRASGEHARHYLFADAGEIMPYRVFVPSKYDGRTRLPLVVVLHGGGADQDTYFKLRGPVLVNEAEKHGFIVVTPLGYRPSGGWGRAAAPFAPPGAPVDPGRARMAELSEKDAFNVIDLVAKEYGTDPARTYLMGNSMGGAATWHLGAKYPDRWAAIAPCAAATVGEGFPIESLKGMPILYTVGENDNVERSRQMVRWAKDHGLEIPISEIKDGTHDLSIWINLPNIFNFFEQHRRNRGTS